jgi:signal transduction histidine kinase
MSATSLLHNPLVLISALLALALVGLALSHIARRRRRPAIESVARQAILDSLSDGLIVVDLSGTIIEHNPAAARLAALIPAARGRALVEAAGDRALGAALGGMLVHSVGPGERTVTIQASQPRLVQVTLKPLVDPAGRRQGALLILRDMTEQERAEEVLARPAADLTSLHQVAEAAGSTLDLPALLAAIVTSTREALGITYATVGLFDEARGQLTISAESAIGPGGSMVGMAIPLPCGPLEQAWHAEPIAIEDPRNDSRLAFMGDLLARRGTHTLLIIPLRAGNQLFGTLNLASGTPRRFDQQELALARMIAGYVAAALANARLFSATRQAERTKSAILDAVSHEFRTPLTAILGFTELYQESVLGPVTDEQQEALEAVHRNAHRLLKLVDDLLDLARLESGRLDLSLYPVEVSLCIQEAAGALAPQLKQKQLELRMEIAEGLPLAWADSMWLRRVLVNLLSNAVRFTSAGEIAVRAYETLKTNPGTIETRRLVIEIEDSGQGIPESEQELIFEAFQRAEGAQATTPTSSGAGLGLTISKRAIDQMEGQLELRSQPGRGSIFSITLNTAELALEHPRS